MYQSDHALYNDTLPDNVEQGNWVPLLFPIVNLGPSHNLHELRCLLARCKQGLSENISLGLLHKSQRRLFCGRLVMKRAQDGGSVTAVEGLSS
jgi:hypothetical protein